MNHALIDNPESGAGLENVHVNDGTEEWIKFRKGAASSDESSFARSVLDKTIYVGVWCDQDAEILVDDGGHQGRPWLIFARGEDPDLATKMRTRLLSEIRARWPEARDDRDAG